jgi:SAM-dependent methyltransferase
MPGWAATVFSRMEPLATPAHFGPEVYERLRAGTQRSARALVPTLVELFSPSRVVDVGAGEGWWAREFAHAGCSVVAVDESVLEEREDGGVRFAPIDLEQPDIDLGVFDLAVCLEVAEHVPESSASQLVELLCQTAPTVLFSAAIPGQGGHGHLNEQWPSYWSKLFSARGYKVSGALRCQFWDDERIEPWYRQNLLVASREGERWPELFDPQIAAPRDLVHPDIFQWRTDELLHLRARPIDPQPGRGLRRIRYRMWRWTGVYLARIPR